MGLIKNGTSRVRFGRRRQTKVKWLVKQMGPRNRKTLREFASSASALKTANLRHGATLRGAINGGQSWRASQSIIIIIIVGHSVSLSIGIWYKTHSNVTLTSQKPKAESRLSHVLNPTTNPTSAAAPRSVPVPVYDSVPVPVSWVSVCLCLWACPSFIVLAAAFTAVFLFTLFVFLFCALLFFAWQRFSIRNLQQVGMMS